MDQSCINVRAIPSFKFLTEHYDVSEDTLKEIIYKYRIETNNGEAVPTIAYINAQIGKTQYIDANPLAKELWKKSYSTPKEFSTEEAFKGAKEKALKFFPENAIVTYTNSNGNRVLAIKEPVQKINPYHRKDFKTWQEYNDYLLTMGDLVPVEERDKEEQVIGNQPFTFNDGTTVTVPFKPNSQQEEALNAMNDFLKSNETSMTLSGYAGTGKTSLMEIIAKKARKEHRKIVFSASTNKAAAVLRNRVKSAGFDAQTLNKVFGIQVEVDTNKPYDASNLVNKLKEANITPGTVVVIDEASMINEENFRILNGIAQENDLKIIYVGDKGQLAPVNESQISKVFRNNTGRIVNLTKVERTEGNAILKEATDIRSGKPLSGESSFNKEGKGVAYVKKSNKAAIKAIVEKFVPKLKENPDYFRILAYTNAAVARYNEAVRRALGYTDNTPRVNEPIVGYNNWGYVYDKNGGTYRFINSEAYKVTKVGKSKEVNWNYPINGVKVKLTYTPVTLEDAMGKSQIIDFIDIKGNEENRRNAIILAKEKARLWREAMSYPKGSKMRLSILNQVNEIEDFLFVNDNIVDDVADSKGKHPVLQKKVFDFGYAMTVHKSQGSTFTNVMVDDADISTARNTASSWNDVLLGDNISLDMGEEFDESSMEVQESGNLMDLINNTPTTPLASPATTDTNSTNLRQQLEYVAVSRATDTVTVIANDANVKKEDTPLNHTKEQNSVSVSNKNQASEDEAGRKAAIKELVDHLTAQGLSVKFRADMEKYFKEHPNSLVQQVIAEQKEMQSIREQAIADGRIVLKEDGTFDYALAPNGKKSNLTERQWLQVRTKNFINWFGDWEKYAKLKELHDKYKNSIEIEDKEEREHWRRAEFTSYNSSVIIDENGEPLVVYHYNDYGKSDIRVFDKDKSTNGFWFTTNKNPENIYYPNSPSKNVVSYPSFLNIRRGTINNATNEKIDIKEGKIVSIPQKVPVSPEQVQQIKEWGQSILQKWTENETFYAVFNPNQIKSATDNNGVFSTENDDIQMAISRSIYNSDLTLSEKRAIRKFIESLSKETDTSRGLYYVNKKTGFIYKFNTSLVQYKDNRNAGRDGFEILEKYDVTHLNKQDRDNIENGLKRTKQSINSIIAQFGLSQRSNDDSIIIIDYGEGENLSSTLDQQASTGNRRPSDRSSQGNQKESLFITPEGEVYGFVDPQGNIYIDETIISPEHLVHEYTHLWDRYVARKNPKFWKRGVELMKDPNLKLTGHTKSLWQEVEEDANYGQKWQQIKQSNPTEYENLMASEVHAKLTGKYGLRELNKIAKQRGAKGLIAKLKQWILDYWKGLKATFSNWSDEEINDLTMEKIVQMTVRDFADGVNFQKAPSFDISGIPSEKAKQARNLQLNKIEHLQAQIDVIEGKIKWNKATEQEKEELEVLKQQRDAEQALYDGLETGTSEIYINEHGVGQIRKALSTTQQTQQQSLPSPETKINIYAGTGENADLSNFALRPFRHQFRSGGHKDFQSVEQAFQYIKATQFADTRANDGIARKGKAIEVEIMETTNGATLRQLGKSIKELNVQAWDRASSSVMKELLKESFEQNPQALQRLLATGNATLTHTQDKGKWGTEFPRLLMEVREELRGLQQQPTQQATVPEDSPSGIKVKLPGYEYFYDLYEDSEVDAQWKVPILQDLDSQLSTENTAEENHNILAQMTRVMQATSEEDYSKAPTPERKEVNDKMSDYWRRNNQMNALIENEVGLTASEIREVSEQIVNSISDIITEIQANPEKAKEYFPTYNADIDLSKVSRKEVAQAVKIDNLIQEAKRRFENIRYDESNGDAYELYNNSFELMDQADLILDNWDTIMELAADVFVANEGFSIKRDTKGQRFELSEREFTGYDYDNFVDLQDEDAIREEKDEQEHWQVEVKTISAINSMSDLVRLAYHNCYLYDRDGNKVLDKWGIPKRVNKVTAVAQTLRWTQGTLNMQQMIQKLEQKKAKNPWLQQLIDRLNDTSGKEADFQSQFYGVMHRHFQLYDIGQLDKGTYSTKTLNNHVALTEIMKGISAKFQLKGHPLFSKDGSVNKDDLERLKGWHKQLTDIVKKYNIRIDNRQVISNTELSDEDFDTAVKCLSAASRMLGYDISEDAMKEIVTEDALYKMQNKLGFAIDNLDKQVGKKDENYNPFDYEVDNNIRSEVMGFLTPIVEELEDIATNAFFESGKMYQSYVIPSFLTQLFDHFKQDSETFQQWVDSAYGQSEWFKDKKGNWRLDMLDLMVRSEKAREVFAHKVQLNFNKHDYMRNMSPEELTLSVLTEHFSERLDMKNLDQTPAWFRVPIQSNKPSSEFIRFYADRSTKYKDNIAEKMYHMFLQELSRIDTVRKRNKKKGDAGFIASFDENGGKFHFLPFLNQYLEENNHSELGNLLKDKVKAERELSEQEDKRLMDLVQEETKKAMQERIDKILDSWDNTGILKAAEKIQGIKILNRSVRENLENFLWNDFYMANAILQLTIVDKAFYPTATELQKRLAELHAPGTRGYKEATDYKGNRVSDGYHRTVLIKDFDGFVANIIDNIAIVFDRKIAAAPEREKAGLRALKESLVGENGAYRKINVTDGEAYSCISSYRKKAFMFGKWSHKAEEIYNRLRNGDYTLSDLEVAFQPLKPFIYGHVQKSMGVENAPITQIPVPFQAKNAEYLLIMADALTRDEDTGRPNLLRAIFNIMEESERRFPTQGIDTVGFNSTIKSGEQGAIDLTEYVTMEGGEAGAYKLMEQLIFQDAEADDLTNYNYNDYVHKIDYDNYALQQEVPAHFREHEQVELSQLRMNIPADLDFYNFDGEVNLYSWKDPDGTEHKMNAKEFRKEYERVHADNIEKGLNQLSKELHLDSTDKKARNLALSEILQNEIISSPRYGLDLFLACQIDPATGEFRIPKGDPIQGKRIEQLINSIIKNRVNKLTVSGGPIVQVTNFGTSKQLHIRFTDKQGNIMPTKEEYEAEQHDESYQEYCAKNQAGIAHFEIFAPIGMKQVFDKFKNPDGTIDIDAVEKCDPELLKVITGRCPNEDKYSIAHGKIVGFMPALAGDAIMFPYELTEIDDSDFDVDKRYTMQKSVDIVEDTSKIKQSLFDRVVKSYQAAHNGQISHSKKQELRDAVNMLMDNPERMKTVDNLMGSLYQEYQKILQEEKPYKTKYPKKGSREANNNQIIDMCWAVMSNEMTADKVLNPGGFEAPKHTAYVIAAYKNSDGTIHFEDLEKMSTKELQKIASTEMDLAWFDDHVQFYKQNAAGSNLIGVFAVNKVAHAILEGDNILINIQDFCGEKPFTICDMVFDGMMPLDSAKDTKGMLVGKNLGSGVGASADTAKDPWLDRININMTTIGMFNSLLRMRMPMDDAELFMAQDVIFRLMNEFNRRSLENKGTSIDDIIQEKLDIIKKKNGYTEASEINTQALTREELIQGLIPIKKDNSKSREVIEYKTLLAFSKIKTLSKAIRKPTLVTRLNSMSAAVGPLIIDNIILWHKLSEFLDINCENGKTGFYVKNEDGTFSTVDMDDILYDHPILKQFSVPVDQRNPNCPTKILFSDMPAGSSLFQSVLKALPANISDRIYDDRPLLSKLSDFFQSYLLVANGVIKPNDLKYLIEDFPKEFEGIGEYKDKGIKVQYPDNAFIQSIQLNYEKKSNRAFLNINTTGMLEQEKERLRMAWTDLHKANPELSIKLFTYAFFRGGIGFSPKTFMGLVPTYVKERIPGYVDTYRHFPQIMEKTMLDQFIRNNWDNSTLVPFKGGEGTNYDIDLEKGVLIVRSENDKKDLAGIKYMKTASNNQTYLWRLLGEEIENKRERYYVRVKPLGNNGEYVEMSTTENIEALDNTTILEIEEETPEMPEVSPMESTASDVETPTTIPESDAQQTKNIINWISLQNRISMEEAGKHFEKIKKATKNGTEISTGYKHYFVNLFKQAGLQLSLDEAAAKFKEFC